MSHTSCKVLSNKYVYIYSTITMILFSHSKIFSLLNCFFKRARHIIRSMNRKDFVRFMILRTIGNFLLLFSIAGLIATFGASLYYEAAFRVGQLRGINYSLAEEIENSEETELGKLLKKYQEMDETRRQGPGLAEVLASNNERVLVPPDSEF